MFELFKSLIKRIFRKKNDIKEKSELEIIIENKIISSITEAIFVCTGQYEYNMLTKEILKKIINDEKFFQHLFGDIVKRCVDNKTLDFLSEFEILEKVGCFIAFNYSNAIDLHNMTLKKNEYFSKKMRHIIKSACDELFLNNKKGVNNENKN